MEEPPFNLRRYFIALWAGLMVIPLASGAIDLVSTPDAPLTPPASGAGDSYLPILSADGRYILFASTANNLAASTNGLPYRISHPGRINVFLRDQVQGTTTAVSVDPQDAQTGDFDSLPTGISTNGRYALFESSSRMLTAADTAPTNVSEIYLRDMVNKTTTLVSPGNPPSASVSGATDSTMTPDGRYVAFSSRDGNLVSGDTNNLSDVFVRDTVAGGTIWVSVGAMDPGTAFGGGFSPLPGSDSPVITPDGRFVAFQSSATNLVPDVSTIGEIYVRDLVGSNTVCVSSKAHTLIPGTIASFNQRISDDGKYVAFEARSFSFPPTAIVLRHNLQTGTDDVISTNATVPPDSYKIAEMLDMSPDGRFITYLATTNSSTEVYLWDGQSGTTTFVSAETNGLASAGDFNESPSVDASGRFVTFLSFSTRLTTNTPVLAYHLYSRDVQSGTTKLVDVATNGAAAESSFDGDHGMSADGRFVVFDSADSDFVREDNNGASDVFVRDVTAGSTELVSGHDPLLVSATSGLLGKRSGLRISADGHMAVFVGPGSGMTPGDTNRFRNIFARDLVAQTNLVISVDTNEVADTRASSAEAAVSGDGRYVVFTSWANDLVANDTNHAPDVFMRDLSSGTTTLVSKNAAGTGPGGGASYQPTIGIDGRFVTFFSAAKDIVNLQAGSAAPNLIEWDRTSGTKYALTSNGVVAAASTPDGHYVAFYGVVASSSTASNLYIWDSQLHTRVFTNFMSRVTQVAISTNGQWVASLTGPALVVTDWIGRSNVTVSTGLSGAGLGLKFSDDGRYLVYSTTASNSVADSNRLPDVYVFDLQARSNILISQSFSTAKAPNGGSGYPDISADGRYVVYESEASDIVPSDNNNSKDIFLYDRQAGLTTLLSADVYGGAAADFVSQAPSFTGGGQTVAFQSWATDLVGNDFNQGSDLFMMRIASTNSSGTGTNPPPVFSGELVYSPTIAGENPRVTWTASAGRTYVVQYKDNLTDPQWQQVNGSAVVEGTTGSIIDLAPNSDHRFYRILAY